VSVRVCGALPEWKCSAWPRVVVDLAEEDDDGNDRLVWMCHEHALEAKARSSAVMVLEVIEDYRGATA